MFPKAKATLRELTITNARTVRRELSAMFNTETFINEIKQRPCIWDLNSESYGDRKVTRQAWESLVKTLVVNWKVLSKGEFEENVWQMQKKWKGLRDYFVRKKKVFDEDRPTGRMRRAPYLWMLQFLRSSCKSTTKATQSREKRDRPTRTKLVPAAMDFESDFSISSVENDPFEKVGSTPSSSHISEIPEPPPQPMSIRAAYDETDANLNFVLNILPDMRTMTERQNFEFRLEVMNLINKIKYGNNQCQRSSIEVVVKSE